MMVKDLGPLDWRTAIVDTQGRPSPEFQRRWNTQRNNNALIGTITFGSGAPTGTPDDGAEYADTSTTPYTLYIGNGGTWHKAGSSGANPTATASDTAVNGTATTFMRSDAAPAVQKASSSQFGLVKVDGTTITSTGGVISSSGGGSSVSYDPVILAESSLIHYWKMNESAGSTSLADSKGATALTITDTISNVTCGVRGSIADGSTAILLGGNATKTNGIINITNGVFPSSGDYSFEFIMEHSGYYPFLSSLYLATFFCIDTNGTGSSFHLYVDSNRTPVVHQLRGSISGGVDNYASQTSLSPQRAQHIIATVSASGNLVSFFINGIKCPITFSGTPRQTAVGAFGSYLPSRDANAYPWQGKISKFAIYNTALTQTQAALHYAATGLF